MAINVTTKLFERKPGVYEIKNLVNNKIYIGQTKNVYQRFINHRAQLRLNKHNNSHLQRSFNKHSELNFIINVLEYCDEKDLTEKEIYYINQAESVYNIREASDSVIHYRRASITEETRLKLSLVKKGIIPSNLAELQQLNRKKIAYFINDDLVQIFESCKDAANNFKITSKAFHYYIGKKTNCNSKYFPKGYKFEYYV
jgi:predicted GIY-YIG superfamily endonuclease